MTEAFTSGGILIFISKQEVYLYLEILFPSMRVSRLDEENLKKFDALRPTAVKPGDRVAYNQDCPILRNGTFQGMKSFSHSKRIKTINLLLYFFLNFLHSSDASGTMSHWYSLLVDYNSHLSSGDFPRRNALFALVLLSQSWTSVILFYCLDTSAAK